MCAAQTAMPLTGKTDRDYITITELWIRYKGRIWLVRDDQLIQSWPEKEAPIIIFDPKMAWAEVTELVDPRIGPRWYPEKC